MPSEEYPYRVYIVLDEARFFARAYKREHYAMRLVNKLEAKYKPFGYTVEIEVVPRPEGGHSMGSPSQGQDNSPMG